MKILTVGDLLRKLQGQPRDQAVMIGVLDDEWNAEGGIFLFLEEVYTVDTQHGEALMLGSYQDIKDTMPRRRRR